MKGDRDRHVTLVVPGLLGPPIDALTHPLETARLLCEGLRLKALERFFSRARPLPCSVLEPGLTALLFHCFGLAREGPDWPVAAVTARLDGAGGDGRWWLRADPVHLRAGMGDLTLLDSAQLPITAAEAAALAAEINAHMEQPGFQLEALAPGRWYLRLEEAPRLLTQAPWDVSGSSIGAHLPMGEDAGRWRACINEVQMILHASAVNRAREDRGEPAVNSLWLWGGGAAPQPPTGIWQGVCGDNALLAGLAMLARAPGAALPADAGAWLAGTQAPGNYLLVSSVAYAPARNRDVDAWRRAVSIIEECWMAPLLEALESDRLQSVRVRGAQARDFRLTRSGLGAWWRRRKAFPEIMCAGLYVDDTRGP